jgi:hypothetical protein
MTAAAPAQEPPKVHPEAHHLGRILRLAWMAIVLGLLIQVLIVIAKMAAGAPFPGMKWLPDIMSGITWSLIVCAGVGLGVAAGEARKAVMGVLGLISAPMGFLAAKGVQRAVQAFMDAPVDKIAPIFYATAAVRTVEYAALGAALGWLLSRPGKGAVSFAMTGFVAGLIFGGITLGLTMAMSDPKPAQLAALVVNELLFPVGCAVVIFLASRAGRMVATLQDRGAA